jgi:hypothetical protein
VPAPMRLVAVLAGVDCSQHPVPRAGCSVYGPRRPEGRGAIRRAKNLQKFLAGAPLPGHRDLSGGPPRGWGAMGPPLGQVNRLRPVTVDHWRVRRRAGHELACGLRGRGFVPRPKPTARAAPSRTLTPGAARRALARRCDDRSWCSRRWWSWAFARRSATCPTRHPCSCALRASCVARSARS